VGCFIFAPNRSIPNRTPKMKNLVRSLVMSLLALAAPALHAGHLKVTITPTQAVSAGAQWRVDGGVWRSSGTTVKNLTNTAHSVEFKTVNGWVAPAAASVTLSGTTTTSITRAYVLPASLTVNLNPVAATWRVDGGAWRSSGTTATGLAPGNHSLEYAPAAGYTAPPAETVALTAGQTQTLSRTYAEVPPTVRVNLTPSNARWKLDSGGWNASGATVTTVPGTHTVSYESVTGYTAPNYDLVSLVRGDVRVLDRTYTPRPATFSVTLASAVGQWRIDGGAWQASAASLSIAAGT
jgi:hypothetical protein